MESKNEKNSPPGIEIKKKDYLDQAVEIAGEYGFSPSDLIERQDAMGFERREDRNYPLLQLEVRVFDNGIKWHIECPIEPRIKVREYETHPPEDLRTFLRRYLDEITNTCVELH